jgi:hypothetical protein
MSGSPPYLIHDANDDIQLVRTIQERVDTLACCNRVPDRAATKATC